MQYISLEQILQLHALVLLRYGGATGVRDVGRLEAVVASQYQEVFGEELHKTVHEKSATLIRGIIADHPFSDGNKRTAMLSGLTFLEINGYSFIAELGELEDFAVQVAVESLGVGAIADWLKEHSSKMG